MKESPHPSFRRAVDWFQGPEHYNCAQAVLRAFESNPCLVRAAARSGHGKAPGGICGSLHALNLLVTDPRQRERLEKAFVQQAGSSRCREIRKAGRISCRGTVDLAQGLLEDPRVAVPAFRETA